MKNLPQVILGICLLPFFEGNGQEAADKYSDTLPEIIVKSFEWNRRLIDVPASINYFDKNSLHQFSTASIVSAINTLPGARIEERSPGSYRVNIRGSSLRSPFGVRNVKVYYNDIPITGPGGLTYLNQLGFYNFNSIEIIKGPGSSLYGQGTGGVLLIDGLSISEKPALQLEYTTGSFGTNNLYGNFSFGNENATNNISFQHLSSAGYRNHSAMQRGVLSWDGKYNLGKKDLLKTTILFGDLFYETPGALTKLEYDNNARLARQGNAFFPGAEQANAAIHQKSFIAGVSYQQQVLPKLTNKSVLYGMFTELKNPNIQNYDRVSDPHWGGRTTFQYKQPIKNGKLQADIGFEFQNGNAQVNVFKNVNGNADSLRSNDFINTRQSYLLAQFVADIKSWTITMGSSFNLLHVQFERFAPASFGMKNKNFDNQMAPRISVMKKFAGFNIYAGIARGFSPPTTSELFPSGGAVNVDLQAERGTNYDIGLKGSFFEKLFVDVNAFSFSLRNNIVQRRNAAGGDFYINAGRTSQRGMETNINYQMLKSVGFLKMANLWLSHTWHHFHYKEFVQGISDFSGNQMPSVAPHTISTGIALQMPGGWTGNASYFFSDKIPLNDANTAYANAFHLMGLKIGRLQKIDKHVAIRVAVGVDNLLNQKYSLGNDANGFGGRYYNAAAGRNYYASILLQWMKQPK